MKLGLSEMDPAALQVLHAVLAARRRGERQTVCLPGADLRGAQLMRADLVGADLSAAGLDHANLAGAKLGKAQLDQALLRYVDLAGADLTGAALRGADLEGARVEGASLAGADLRGVALVGVIGEPATVAGARIDYQTSERSSLLDADVIKLWREGVRIDCLEDFGLAVQGACAEPAAAASEAGPPARSLVRVEAQARQQRLDEDGMVPPSARALVEAAGFGAARSQPEEPAPLSSRSLKLVAPLLTPELIAAPGWAAGDRVLGVTLDAVVGTGNAATVWRAVDDDGAPVALKLFDTKRAGMGLTLPSYRRGVAVMNRLMGGLGPLAGVVSLRAVSLNQLAFSMDWADNGSIVDLPALGWGARSTVEFFCKLCAAVDRAHQRGALHRCLKPSNILLTDDLDPWLCDFDMIDLPTVAATSHDAGGYRYYASPEELLGTGTQSPTSDIYALGRILYFLLRGAHPDEAPAELPALEPLARQPAGLSRIVRKCTVRAPEARYQTVADLLADLERYDDYQQVGLAGGAAEANYLPYRVSSLPHDTVWLGSGPRRAARDEARDRPAPDAAPRANRRRTRAAAPHRSAERRKLIGALSAVLMLASLLVVVVVGDACTHLLLRLARFVSALAAGGITSLLPPVGTRWRWWQVTLALGAIALVYLLDLPALFAPPSLR